MSELIFRIAENIDLTEAEAKRLCINNSALEYPQPMTTVIDDGKVIDVQFLDVFFSV